MIKVILIYQGGDNTQEYCAPSYKIIFVKNEEEFWEIYNSSNEYIKCEDELAGTFRVYLKKDKIIDIRIEQVIGD